MAVYAAVEGGGTGWKVALVNEDLLSILEEAEFDTTTPEDTLGKIKSWLSERSYDALGVASFGPVDARPDSDHYGFITTTPKPGWKDTDVLGLLGARDQPHIPYLFDTDVNAPALAEYMNYNARGNVSSFAYITVGTGVGVGIVVNGQTIKGQYLHSCCWPPQCFDPLFYQPISHLPLPSYFLHPLKLFLLCLQGWCTQRVDTFPSFATPTIALRTPVPTTTTASKATATTSRSHSVSASTGKK